LRSSAVSGVKEDCGGRTGAGPPRLFLDGDAEQAREHIVELVRDFFSSQGTISCLYVKLYESTDDRLVGGLVLEDDRHFAFVYENGQLSYEEEA